MWSLGVAVLGVVACLLWLARDVAAVPPDRSAAPAPPAARLYLRTPAVFTYPLTIALDMCDTFGPRLLSSGAYTSYDFSLGVDWCAAENTPVHAVTTGTVQSFSGDCAPGTASCFVHLTHADADGQTRYDHLGSVHSEITNSLEITPEQVIGWVGRDTGAPSAYLHFEVHDGTTVTQRAAIHPLSTPFLPWTNRVSPTIELRGVYTDATGLTALVGVTSPYTEPDVLTVSVTVSGTLTDSRIIDYVDLNANTSSDGLNDPLVRDVCIIPSDLNATDGYSVTMAFRQLNYSSPATVTAQAIDVGGLSSTRTVTLTGGLDMAPPAQAAGGRLGQSVAFVYTLTNRSGASGSFTFTHLSAQSWPAVVTPTTRTLAHGESVTVTLQVTLNTNRPGSPDCGLLVAEAAQTSPQQVVAGFYRLRRVIPLTGVEISGPTTGTINAAYTFTATASPPTATVPITYHWQATGLSPQTHIVAGVTDTAAFAWSTLGPQTITVTATNAGGTVSSTHAITITVAQFPFYDGFESGTLDGGWTVYTTTQGRVQVSDTYPYSGTYSALLDDATKDDTPSIAALILNIDLAGQSGVVLDFWWREFYDENHPQDGVFISDDDGAHWYQVLSFNNGPLAFRHEVIYLDAQAAAYSLTFNDHFQIKFQFYDDYPIADDGYAIDNVWVRPEPVASVEISGPTNGNIDTTYTFTATVSPPTATLPISYTWSPPPASGQGSAIVSYTWPVTGLKTITVTAINMSGSASNTHSITINVPPNRVDISGPTRGNIDTAHVFTATVSPPTATLPITYTWQATDQSDIVRVRDSLNNAVSYTWNTPGSKVITVIASNVGGSVARTHVITVNVPPAGMSLGGPSRGVIQVDYPFTADVSPVTTTLPITYVWEATEQSPLIRTDRGLSDVVSFNWTLTGTKMVTVTASNVGGAVIANHVITLGISPVTSVTISAPITSVAYVRTPLTATVSPVTATQPITYIWEATDRPAPVVHEGGSSDRITFTWRITGTKFVTVTAINVGGVVTDTRVITIVSAIAPGSVAITGPTEGVVQFGQAFTAVVSPVTTTAPITYVWYATDNVSQTHISDLDDTAVFAWDTPGTKTITVTAANPLGAVSQTHVITTRISPLTGVALGGATAGVIRTGYPFTATVSPITATAPITYHWRATGQGDVVTATDVRSHVVPFAWDTPGPKVITVSATNVGDTFTDTHIITISVPLASVGVGGPTLGNVNTSYIFTATISPLTATTPITYHWRVTGQADVVTSTDVPSHTVSLTWDTEGTKTIVVTATNAGGSVTNTHVITVIAPLTGLDVSGPTIGNVGTLCTFTATVSPGTVSVPITYHWRATGQADVVTSTDALSHVVPFTWDTPGTRAITVTATNVWGGVMHTHVIVVNIPLTGVHIDGPTTGRVNTSYTFTANTSPTTASLPIDYVWSPTPATGQGSALVTYTWPAAGLQTIVVTATNMSSWVSDTHSVATGVPVEDVIIQGPTTAYVNRAYAFTAAVSPTTATEPIAYDWSPEPAVGQGSAVVEYVWSALGPYIIGVTATNVSGAAVGSHVITVELNRVHLPMVVRDWPLIVKLYAIDNSDGDGSYTVRWSSSTGIEPITYVLEQDQVCDAGLIPPSEISVPGTSYGFNQQRAGRYCYRVKACADWGCGDWSNTVCVDVLEEHEDNNLRKVAQSDGPLCSNKEYRGWHNDDSDFFSVYLRNGEDITVDLTTPLASGLQLLLYYGEGNELARVRDYVSPYHVEYEATETGWYFIRIYTPGEASGTRYTLQAVYP